VRDAYGIKPGEVDLPMLPIFALFNPALGMTTIVPEIDPSRPATVDPMKIVQAILQERVTNSFGSPTLWRIIFDHCLEYNRTLPSLRRILCAGAAVPASLWADAPSILVNGTLHSPYGATEVLPVATVSGNEVFAGATNGSLIGRALRANQVKIIALHDGPIASLTNARELSTDEIGEIIVTGPTVTKAYDQLPDATAAAKIAATKGQGSSTKYQEQTSLDTSNLSLVTSAPAGAVWHRMGDAGYLDADGLLWFCGRIAERVVTSTGIMHTEPVEQVFRGYPGVARCALVGIGEPGKQEPALVVQPAATVRDRPKLAGELRALALQNPHTVRITRILFHSSFPVDVRHNAKIHRLTLARWAAKQKSQ
jgi:acyl-CoA synthetase (AMP-forming)/AMP-acid ligase II